MSKDRWSDAKTRKFISSYIRQPALWNVSDPNYAIRAKKELGYNELMEEFGLTLTEVKNKIRIYRTTYGQEVKKMEGNGASPKLNWFNEMHLAFTQGKIKSFTKSPSVRVKSERQLKNAKLVEIDYGVDNENDQELSEKSSLESDHQIIIEQYQEADEDEYSDPLLEEIEALDSSISSNTKKFKTESKPQQSIQNNNKHSNDSSEPSTGVNSFLGSGMVSNELFLKSLQSTLDNLPDQKNMRARIKIQEVLYKIAYDIDD